MTPPALSVELPAKAYFDFDLVPPAGTPPGSYAFEVEFVCDGVVKAAQQIAIEVPGWSAPPGSIGNALRATKQGADVALDWSAGPPPSYNVQRVAAKLGLVAPRMDAPHAAPSGAERHTEPGAVGAAPALQLYDVWGRDCASGSIFR